MGFGRLKARHRRAVLLLGALGQNLSLVFFQSLEAACIPWLTVPSSISKANSETSVNLSLIDPLASLL